ncbi:Rrf2 family transcriptional regulator [Tabrizicola sp. J26]|uniref:RrF2 family transcriptional regulator n=1 Tax=Alitabrizicola rongguiensis TaxID=2909234 RepID=UPI001F45CAB0|nr:Rrf2 family transcriptional regulator [Tabrizicola rongguiensis]MCF1709955.1 Rrf2 family transcriptional regulator [Tabrizicola rongguiensis]
MRLTMRTSLALRTLMFCAVNDGRIVQRHEISTTCDASENHLAQVIHLLARNGYIKTRRGRHGGLSLARPAGEITVGQVFRSFEAPLPFADCWQGSERECPLKGACRLACVLKEAIDAFYARLDRTTLAELVDDNGDLQTLLKAA